MITKTCSSGGIPFGTGPWAAVAAPAVTIPPTLDARILFLITDSPGIWYWRHRLRLPADEALVCAGPSPWSTDPRRSVRRIRADCYRSVYRGLAVRMTFGSGAAVPVSRRRRGR